MSVKQFETEDQAKRYAHAIELTDSQYAPCTVAGKLVFLCGSQNIFMDPLLTACDKTYTSLNPPAKPFTALCNLFSHGTIADLRKINEINPKLQQDLRTIVNDICRQDMFSEKEAKEIYAEQIIKIYEQTTACKIVVADLPG